MYDMASVQIVQPDKDELDALLEESVLRDIDPRPLPGSYHWFGDDIPMRLVLCMQRNMRQGGRLAMCYMLKGALEGNALACSAALPSISHQPTVGDEVTYLHTDVREPSAGAAATIVDLVRHLSPKYLLR